MTNHQHTKLDVVNHTTFFNCATPFLMWQTFASSCDSFQVSRMVTTSQTWYKTGKQFQWKSHVAYWMSLNLR